MGEVVGTEGSGEDFDEALGLVACPALGTLTIFAKLVLHEVVGSIATYGLETVGTQFQSHLAVDMALRRSQHSLNVWHHRLQVLTLVQEHTIPVCHLLLPVLLPLRQSIFLEEAVSADDEHGSSSLEAYTTLDTHDGITNMAIATDGILCTNLLYSLNSLYLIVVLLAVYRAEFTLLEAQLQEFTSLLCGMLQISTLRQALLRVENLTAADTGTPDTHVVRVLQLCEVGIEAVLVQVVHLFLTTQVLVACQSDDFHTGSHHEECHIETNLVVTGTRTSVCNSAGTNLIGIASNGDSLEDTFT